MLVIIKEVSGEVFNKKVIKEGILSEDTRAKAEGTSSRVTIDPAKEANEKRAGGVADLSVLQSNVGLGRPFVAYAKRTDIFRTTIVQAWSML